VLITSRSPAWHGVAEALPVGLLAEASAIDLLLRRTNSSDEEDAAVLATELGRLPLALEQAASYVADQGISLADYLDLYRLRQADLLRRGVPLAYEGTVATVVTLSLENLSSQQSLAVVVVELCALLAPDEIPISSIIRSGQLLSQARARRTWLRGQRRWGHSCDVACSSRMLETPPGCTGSFRRSCWTS
jgi:hypothetical protein